MGIYKCNRTYTPPCTYTYIHIQHLVIKQDNLLLFKYSNLISPQRLSRKQNFYQQLQTDLSSSGILSSDQISEIINIYSAPCPTSSRSER